MTLMERVLHLYQVDSQVRGLRSRVESAEIYLRAQNRQRDSVASQRDETATRKKHVQATVSNLETEVAAIDERLEKLRDELNAAVTNKQYSAILAEMNSVKEQRNELDDRTIAEMEQIEKLDAELATFDEQLADRNKVCTAAQSDLEERKNDVGERLTELEGERQDATSGIPDSVLTAFDDIADLHDGEALASIEEINRRHREYACTACNIHLPYERVSLAMLNGDELVLCPACGRILFMQEELRGALGTKK